MQTEVSAGGVVIRAYRGGWQVLLIRDMNGNWTFPKGLIDKRENAESAARREIREETKVGEISYLKKLPSIKYMYQRGGLISKTVYYFLFRAGKKSRLSPQKDEGISQARWVSLPQALSIVGYPQTNKSLLEKAQDFLTTYGNQKGA
ncbi:MAG: NUDIX hydrolase [Patescibacteria group bacterium]